MTVSSKKRSKKPAKRRPQPRRPPSSSAEPLATILAAAQATGSTTGPAVPTHRAVRDPTPAPPDPLAPKPGTPDPSDEQGQPLLHGIAATFGYDSREPDPPSSVCFTAWRLDSTGAPLPGGVEKVITLPELPAGAGPVTVTARLHPVPEGTWRVEATPRGQRRSARRPVRLGEVRTRLHPLVHGPGVLPLAWPVLVLTGVALALTLQRWLLARHDPTLTGRALLVSALATLVGYLSAKAWYMRLHHVRLAGFVSAGTCIQGFLLGAAATAGTLALATGVPVGLLADATAPGVLLAMALGRLGCWSGGCCAGRPTASRWGLTSSDRCIRVRRVPVQLLEGGSAAALGTVLLAAQLNASPAPDGVPALVAFAGYTAVRQLLFPFRAEARRTSWGRRAVLAGSIVVCVAGVLILTA